MVKNRSSVTITVSDELAEKIMAEHPEITADVSSRIIKKTGEKVIKKILNDKDLLEEAKKKVDRAVAALVRSTGLQKKKNVAWNDKNKFRFKESVKNEVMPVVEREIELHVKAYVEKVIREDVKLRETTDQAVDSALNRCFREGRFTKQVLTLVRSSAKEVLREMIGK